MKKRTIFGTVAGLGLLILMGTCTLGADNDFGTEGNYRHITTEDMCSVLLEHPAFDGFQNCILPMNFAGGSEETMAEHSIQEIMEKVHWDGEIDVIMASLNELIDLKNSGEDYFYRYYTDEEMQEDPLKENCGFVFYKGEENGPFAVVTAGGGYDWYTGMAEGYPVAYSLQEKGYNVFVVSYRVKAAEISDYPTKLSIAMEDYDCAMQEIFKKIDDGTFAVDRESYAVMGFSAGARLAALWGGDATRGYAAMGMPKPQSLLLIYGGNLTEKYGTFDYDYENSPAVYALSCLDDKTVLTDDMREMCSFYNVAGVEAVLDVREKGGHGFGLGEGTDAAGWIEEAEEFWKNHQ